jgi:nicotinic acetylcholine receptor
MAPWVRRVFIHILPRLLVMRRPGQSEKKKDSHHTAAAAAVIASAKENGYDDLCIDQAILHGGGSMSGSTRLMNVVEHNPDVYYKKLPTLPPEAPGVNGGNGDYRGSQRWMVTSTTGHTTASNDIHHQPPPHQGGGSICGSDEDFDKMFDNQCQLHGETIRDYPPTFECPEIYRALDGVRYIAECTMREEESSKVKTPSIVY